MLWLVEQFGAQALCESEAISSTEEYFPAPYKSINPLLSMLHRGQRDSIVRIPFAVGRVGWQSVRRTLVIQAKHQTVSAWGHSI